MLNKVGKNSLIVEDTIDTMVIQQVNMKKCRYIGSLVIVGLFLFSLSSLAQVPSSQTAGGILQQEKIQEKEKKLKERIQKKKEKAEKAKVEEISPKEVGPKVLIKTIKVEGATLIKEKDIQNITSQYEGKELSLSDMQKIADLITDEYRKKGYLTSRAYIPPQTIKKGVLIIRVIEGKAGSLKIEGNRYFRTSLLKKKLNVQPGKPLDYSNLQRSLTYINEHPDRTAKVVLVPGKTPGTTDIILKVKDNFPFHIGFAFDNFGSRYIERERYILTLEHNNLLGFDDKAYFKFQKSEYGWYKLENFRYSIPLTNRIEAGFYYIHTKTKLAKDLEVLDARGKSTIAGIFLSNHIVDKENFDLTLNFGYDYKHIQNYLLGVEDSRDELRIFKTGFDLDETDKFGRSIFTAELDIGVPDMFGGMPSKSNHSSRNGAGGKFYKGVFNLFRLQPGPWDSSFLWKNQAQFSAYNLVASEQFQIGGPYSVRGYTPAEYSGDKGYYTSFEWSLPPYFVPHNVKVPFFKDKFYNTFRIVLFYDWATTYLNKIAAGEKKHRTLRGCGFGFRLNLSHDFSARIEFGYPLGKTPADGDNVHRWIEVTKKF